MLNQAGHVTSLPYPPIRLALCNVRGPKKQDRQLLAPRPHHLVRAPAEEGPLQ